MRKLNKITAFILALVMCMSLAATAFAAETDGNTGDNIDDADVIWNFTGADEDLNQLDESEELALVTSFKDVKTTAWYYNDVTECAKLGIVSGFEDGSFRPDNNVTAVQFLVMMTRTFYNSKVEAVSKPAGSAWYYANTKVAADIGMSKDLAATDINDNKGMTRYNMAIVLYNTLMANSKTITMTQMQNAISAITDIANVPKNYRTYVINCYAQGIITGMSDGSFAGTQSMTRAQACTVIMRMLKLINNYNPGDKDNEVYDDGTSQNPGNNTTSNNGTLANGKAATAANVTAMLDQLKTKYPQGSVWGTQPNLYTNGSKEVRACLTKIKCNASITSGCGAFAAMFSDTIFGNNEGTEVTNMADVRPGDIIVKFNSKGVASHVAIVLYTKAPHTNGNNNDYWNVYVTNGNVNGGYVSWGAAYDMNASRTSQFDGSTYRFVTRY